MHASTDYCDTCYSIIYYFIEQNREEINTVVGLTSSFGALVLVIFSICCIAACKYKLAKSRNNIENNEIINPSLSDENTSVPSSEHTSDSINMSHETAKSNTDNSLETNEECIFDIEDIESQDVCISPFNKCEIETKQLSHNSVGHSDYSVCKEPLSQLTVVSTVNCSPCNGVSQNVFLDEDAKPFDDRGPSILIGKIVAT